MNIKKSLKVLDDKLNYIRKNTYINRTEDSIRVKQSDLRAVLLALADDSRDVESTQFCNHEMELTILETKWRVMRCKSCGVNKLIYTDI